ncbi:DUF4037 domain-containing protein [Anaerosolibacter sp.]|uniref:DUF4037 domain-containing protein n=1 Tax=Anaerosolibacter sp. TaxID=1872527 RepID=UPI0039F0E212
MVGDTKIIMNSLIEGISKMKEVQSIGISGGKAPIPKAGEGDIDIFIYCDVIPTLEKREALIDQMGELIQERNVNIFEGGHWGAGDYVMINGIETWLMYFTVNETLKDVEAILNGDYPDKLDNYYYPVGRCAMFKNINILYDENDFLGLLKKRLHEYPDKLAEILVQYHLDKLEDTEDLERAAARKDVLFYHFAIDLAIDHFLQALFAMNRIYFPSRKRTLDFIKNFDMKPERCSERLLDILKLGSYADGISQSYVLWRDMIDEMKKMYTHS